MDAVLRATVLYFSLLLILRLAGKRNFAQITPFDFVLLLVIGEATQQAITGQDYSITNAIVAITTLVLLSIFVSLVTQRWPTAEKWVDGVPLILLENGKLLEERLRWSRVTENDILHAARKLRGLERLDQIKYAILEVDGGITVIARSE